MTPGDAAGDEPGTERDGDRDGDARTRTYRMALADAYREALATRDDTFLVGEDIREGVLGTTKGLLDAFGGERVRDAPASEQAFHGVAVGAAMAGKRPIVEHQINTLPYVAMDQLVNNAAKLRYMTGGQVSIPVVISIPRSGAIGGYAAQHSDHPYPALMNYGLKTAVPSTPYDLKGLFRAAVEEDDPVVVFGPAAVTDRRGAVPEAPYTVPLGEAALRREGSDVTVVAIGHTVHDAFAVAEAVAGEVDVEVIDPRTLVPFDEETVFESVKRTNRAVVVDDSNRTCGAAAEIAARIADRCIFQLAAPVKRVTRAGAPVSYSPPEEAAVQPNRESIRRAIDAVVYGE